MNNSTWVQLHTLSPETMTTGDIDGGGSADVILDFGGQWYLGSNEQQHMGTATYTFSSNHGNRRYRWRW